MKRNKGILVLVIAILVGSSIVGVGCVSASNSIPLVIDGDKVTLHGSGDHFVHVAVPVSYRYFDIMLRAESEPGMHSASVKEDSGDWKALKWARGVGGYSPGTKETLYRVSPGKRISLAIGGHGASTVTKVWVHSPGGAPDITSESESESPEEPVSSDTITTEIYIQNDDDDDLTITLYKYGDELATIHVPSGGTKRAGRFTAEIHSNPHYRICWLDPDRAVLNHAGEYGIEGTITLVVGRYAKEAESEVTPKSEREIVPESEPEPKRKSHLQPITRVYVRNRDNDPVKAELFIYGKQMAEKNISAGSTKFFGVYEALVASAFSVYWYEPDSDRYIWTDAKEIDDNSTLIVLEPPVAEEEPEVEVLVREEEIPEEVVLEEIVIEQIIPEEVMEEPAPKFKDIMPDNPSAAKGIVVAGITVENAEDYEKVGKYLLLEDYVSETPATTWEDVARYQYYSGKRYFKISEIEADLKVTHKILKLADKLLSLDTTLRKLGGYYKNLDSSTFTELTSDSNLVAGFAKDMAHIYKGKSKTDSEVMKFICTTTSYTSTGLNAYVGVCDRINSEITQSEAYHIQKGTIAYSRAYHAMCIHNIAIKEVVSDQEIEEYFYHVDAFLKLHKMSYYLDSKETRAVWGGTGVWSRTSLTIMTDVLGATTEESRLAWLKESEAAVQKDIDYIDGNIEYMASLKDSGLDGGA